jgi:hypothetical protein
MDRVVNRLDLVRGRLSLAAIEERLKQLGYDQEQIDTTLAFVIEAREMLLNARVDVHDHLASRKKPS